MYFSPDYFTARSRFRVLTAEKGGRLYELRLNAKGPASEDLSIDIGWFGADVPERVLLHSSGLHGVEGFAGSAIQLQLLDNFPELPKHTALILVHILNPYGMAWLRRVNENNVDLNRNFLNNGEFSGAPPSYCRFDSFLNPQSPPRRDLFLLKAPWLVLRYGMPAMKQAVAGGQYDYPQGLFFGGKRLEEGSERYQSFIRQNLRSAQRVVALDVHTGLGKYAEDTLLVEPHDYDPLRPLLGVLGKRVAPSTTEHSPAYKVRGGIHPMLIDAAPHASVRCICQEFGTYRTTRVLRALREENRLTHYGTGRLDHPVKQALKQTFCPPDESWRRSVLRRGQELIDRGLGNSDGYLNSPVETGKLTRS